MSGLQGLVDKTQEEARGAVKTVEKAVKDFGDQAQHACQEGVNKACKQAEDGFAKATEETTKTASNLQKKLGF